MQKPDNKSVKDYIIERVAEDLQFPEDIVETVVSWSFKKVNEASHTKKEIELSGIGTLKLSQAKLRRRIKAVEGILPNSKSEEMTRTLNKTLEDLKNKLDG